MMKYIVKEYNSAKKLKLSIQRNKTVGGLSISLHRFTSFFLIILACISATSKHFGNPISCFTNKKADQDSLNLPENVINSFCFMSNTYSIDSNSEHFNYSGTQFLVQGGLGPDPLEAGHTFHHTFYMWVPFIFFLQALLFYIPHWFWARYEGGFIIKLVAELDEDLEIHLPNLTRSDKVAKVAEYFYGLCGTHTKLIGISWILWDVLGVLNVIGNLYFIDYFLGGIFKFGSPILFWTDSASIDADLFPILTKCHIHTYGSAGSLQLIDSLCVMPLNKFYQYTFTIILYWLPVLALITLTTIFVKLGNITLLKYYSRFYWQSTISVPTKIDGYELIHCVKTMTFGDCVLFNLLSRHMRPMTYRLFVREISDRMIMKKV